MKYPRICSRVARVVHGSFNSANANAGAVVNLASRQSIQPKYLSSWVRPISSLTPTVSSEPRLSKSIVSSLLKSRSRSNVDHQNYSGYVCEVAPFTILSRNASTSEPVTSPEVSYEELLALIDQQQAVVIDVREAHEVEKTGLMPGAINIPLRQLVRAFQLDAEDFEVQLGAQKPGTDAQLVFSCMAGNRSAIALQIALKFDYQRARHYPGGWSKWAENQQTSN